MKTLLRALSALALALAPLAAGAQQAPPPGRLPASLLDAVSPAEWVRGAPGQMTVVPRQCRSVDASAVRRRIVDVAVQEWAFFGFPVADRLNSGSASPESASARAGAPPSGASTAPRAAPSGGSGRRRGGIDPAEGARVAASIAGYWAVTPEGRGVVGQQNREWNERGTGSRWNAPWSAAFISWVMCEGGLGTNERFRRAVAHWTYIDQAIRARDGQAPQAAYVAYDIGERTVEPGDLLCSGRTPAYKNLAERRRQLGEGARSHCDVVVAVDAQEERILAIGGNVLRSVSLKVMPGVRDPAGGLRARATSGLPLFAHLRLRADPVGANALAESPVLAALACPGSAHGSPRAVRALAQLRVGGPWIGGGRGGDAARTSQAQGEQQDGGTPARPTC